MTPINSYAQDDQSGMGVPPMNGWHLGETLKPQNATIPLGKMPKPHGTVESPLQIRQGAYLPHWTRKGVIYAVTFRLGDSLPRSVLELWLAERNNILLTAQQMARPLSAAEERRLQHLHSDRVEAYLDAGHGACWLRQFAIAQIVANALRHFDDQRYQLHAWCIMPNHVHVITEPFSDHSLSSILHSWKSFAAKSANRLLGRTGSFWQEEYYDHLIRDEADFAHAIQYVLENPAKAGLSNWPWSWSKEKD